MIESAGLVFVEPELSLKSDPGLPHFVSGYPAESIESELKIIDGHLTNIGEYKRGLIGARSVGEAANPGRLRLELRGENWQIQDDGPVSTRGMSGGPVWQAVITHETETAWTIERVELVGILESECGKHNLFIIAEELSTWLKEMDELLDESPGVFQ